MKKTIGIVGCGTIGSTLAKYAAKNLTAFIAKIILYDTEHQKKETLAEEISNGVDAGSMEEVFDAADLVVEAASSRIVPDFTKKALEKKKDIMLMSIGGLLGSEDFLDLAREKGIKVLLPTGAISGIDGIKAAKIAGIDRVTLTTRKGPKSIKGAPYLAKMHIDVDGIRDETVIFEGNALEAMKAFPKNINVSALLSIAAIGADKTKVRIIVSPKYTRNIHEIEIEGKAGKMTMRTENVPSPDNPKTSFLAALAAIASLKGYFDTVRIGT